MALDAEIMALGARGQQRSIVEKARHILKANTYRAYQRLLLDSNGELKPDAITVIEDLGRVAQLGRATSVLASDAELREINGRRTMALHFIERIDLSGAKLRGLAAKLRESGSE